MVYKSNILTGLRKSFLNLARLQTKHPTKASAITGFLVVAIGDANSQVTILGTDNFDWKQNLEQACLSAIKTPLLIGSLNVINYAVTGSKPMQNAIKILISIIALMGLNNPCFMYQNNYIQDILKEKDIEQEYKGLDIQERIKHDLPDRINDEEMYWIPVSNMGELSENPEVIFTSNCTADFESQSDSVDEMSISSPYKMTDSSPQISQQVSPQVQCTPTDNKITKVEKIQEERSKIKKEQQSEAESILLFHDFKVGKFNIDLYNKQNTIDNQYFDFDKTITKDHLYKRLNGKGYYELSQWNIDDIKKIFGGSERILMLKNMFDYLHNSGKTLGIISYGDKDVIMYALQSVGLGVQFDEDKIIGNEDQSKYQENDQKKGQSDKTQLISLLNDQQDYVPHKSILIDDDEDNFMMNTKVSQTFHVQGDGISSVEAKFLMDLAGNQ